MSIVRCKPNIKKVCLLAHVTLSTNLKWVPYLTLKRRNFIILFITKRTFSPRESWENMETPKPSLFSLTNYSDKVIFNILDHLSKEKISFQQPEYVIRDNNKVELYFLMVLRDMVWCFVLFFYSFWSCENTTFKCALTIKYSIDN